MFEQNKENCPFRIQQPKGATKYGECSPYQPLVISSTPMFVLRKEWSFNYAITLNGIKYPTTEFIKTIQREAHRLIG